MERAISGQRSVSAPNRIKLIEFKDGEDDFFSLPLLLLVRSVRFFRYLRGRRFAAARREITVNYRRPVGGASWNFRKRER